MATSLTLEEYEIIILRCPHIIYYKKLIEKIAGKDMTIIDGNDGTVRNLMNTMKKSKLSNNNKERNIAFYSSGVEDDVNRVQRLLELINME